MKQEFIQSRFGRGRGQGASQGGGRGSGNKPGSGPNGNCVCPKCGKKVPHIAGQRVWIRSARIAAQR